LTYRPRTKATLKQPSDGKIDARLSGGANAGSQRDGSNDCVGDHAQIKRPPYDHGIWIVEGAAGFVPSAPVDFPAHELRQAIQIPAESDRRIGVVVPDKLAGQVGPQTKGTAKREELKLTGAAVKGTSAGGGNKQGRLLAEGNKRRGLHLQLVDGMDQPRALQHAGKVGDNASAGAWNRRTVLPIPHIAGSKFSGASAERWQAGAADEGSEFAAEDFIAEAQFTASSRVVSDIETAAGSLVAEDSHASLAAEGVSRQFGSEGIGRDEKMTARQRLIKLAGGEIA